MIDFFKSTGEVVASTIAEWNPERSRSENAYKQGLFRHLQEKLPKDWRVQTEYGIGDSKVDIAVISKDLLSTVTVFIELKMNMNSKDKQQRLRGQILEYAPHTTCLFIILCGKTDPKLCHSIKEDLSRESSRKKILFTDFEQYFQLFIKE